MQRRQQQQQPALSTPPTHGRRDDSQSADAVEARVPTSEWTVTAEQRQQPFATDQLAHSRHWELTLPDSQKPLTKTRHALFNVYEAGEKALSQVGTSFEGKKEQQQPAQPPHPHPSRSAHARSGYVEEAAGRPHQHQHSLVQQNASFPSCAYNSDVQARALRGNGVGVGQAQSRTTLSALRECSHEVVRSAQQQQCMQTQLQPRHAAAGAAAHAQHRQRGTDDVALSATSGSGRVDGRSANTGWARENSTGSTICDTRHLLRIGSESATEAKTAKRPYAAHAASAQTPTRGSNTNEPCRESRASTGSVTGATTWSSSRGGSAVSGESRTSRVNDPVPVDVQHPSYLVSRRNGGGSSSSSSTNSTWCSSSGSRDSDDDGDEDGGSAEHVYAATSVGQLGTQPIAQREAAIELRGAAAVRLPHVDEKRSRVVLFEVMQGTTGTTPSNHNSADDANLTLAPHPLSLSPTRSAAHLQHRQSQARQQLQSDVVLAAAAAAAAAQPGSLSNGGRHCEFDHRHPSSRTTTTLRTPHSPTAPHSSTIAQEIVMSDASAALMTASAGNGVHRHSNGAEVGMALTTDERMSDQANNVRYQSTELAFSPSSQGMPNPEPMTDFLEPNQRSGSIQPAGLGLSAAMEGSDSATQRNRVFGLSKDLAGPSPDSAYLPPKPIKSTAGSPNANQVHPAAGNSAYDQPQASSSKVSLSSQQKHSDSSASSNGMPQHQLQKQQQPAPASSAQPGASSQFSIEVIAPSFDKRGYPIFSGRAASIRGIVRMKAIRGCQVEIKLGAYISQGAPAAVWDGLALMPPEQGGDHHIFSISEIVTLDESMMRTRDGASPDSTLPEDLIFETPFDVNLPLGVSTRFVNGEPTVTAVNLPPSYEVSSEGLARERDLLRGTGSALKSGAASIRSRSSRLTNFTTANSQLGATVREAVERGLSETYRIGCFYTMDFTLQRLPDASPEKPAARKFFGGKSKNKTAKPVVLDSITVPFIFLGEQSSEQPPPLSIPALFIANAVARPGSFLGDGWQCERASIKWPGRTARGVRRNLDIEMHMPFPSTLHAPSLFPVLIILRPADARLLDAVPVDFVPLSPTPTDDASASGNTRGGRTHSRQSTMSKSNSQQNAGGIALNHSAKKASSSVGDQDTEELQSYDQNYLGNDTHSITSSATDGFLGRFMRSSLTLTRKNSNGQLNAAPQSTTGLSTSRSNQSIRQAAATEAGGSDRSGGSRAPPAKAGNSGSSGAVSMLRDAVVSKITNKRPNTAPPSQSSSDGRTRMSETTMMGSGGQYTGNLSGLVRVSLVQTTFCVSTGPAELPRNLRRLVSMAEVEELDAESLLAMVRQMNGSAGGAGERRLDEHDLLLQTALEEQLKEKGVRVLRALFRVGSDATPSFRCQGIELRYGIKVDLVPFSVRQKRPSSGGAASASSGGPTGPGSSESGGDGLPKTRSRSSFSSSVDPSASTTDAAAPPYSPSTTSHTTAVGRQSTDVYSQLTAHPQDPRHTSSPALPNALSPTQQHTLSPGQPHASSPVTSHFSPRSGDAASVTTTGDYASTLRGTFRTRSKAGGGSGGGVPRSGETSVSTVYAQGAQSFDKIEKGVGVLFASVRLVRAAT